MNKMITDQMNTTFYNSIDKKTASLPSVNLKELFNQQKDYVEIREKLTASDKVSLNSPVPNSKIVCDVFEWSEEYFGKTKSDTGVEAYQNIMQNYKQDYLHMVNAYSQIFAECDKDIEYCQTLIKNNQDPTRNDLLSQFLEQAKNRRNNIAEQAINQLSEKAQFISAMTDLQTKAMKVLLPKADIPRIEEIAARSMVGNIFEKINQLNFNCLLYGANESNEMFSTLIDLLAPSLKN